MENFHLSRAPELSLMPERALIADLAGSTPRGAGKWFAAAREVATPKEALALASRSPCEPRTLTRAARDWAGPHPEAAVEAGPPALRWIARGSGRDLTAADVRAPYAPARAAATRTGGAGRVRERVRRPLTEEADGGWLAATLGAEWAR